MNDNPTHRQDSFSPYTYRPDRSLAPHDYACSIWMCPTQDRIARELREVAPELREQVWADLTANPKISRYKSPPPEDPDVINRRLEEMKAAVRQLPGNEAYHIAENMAPNYVNDKSFQIMFLRADKFDVQAAALRITQHFEMKKELFGEDVLGRDICLSDLSEDDLESLRRGAFHFLSGRDQAGRRVFWSRYASMGEYRTRANMYRAYWYVNFTATREDEETQKLGTVCVMSFLNAYPQGGPDQELNRMGIKLMNCLPNRTVALYILFADSSWDATLDLLNHLLSPLTRLRTRTICGSYQECKYALKCLGIPASSFPVSSDGSLILEGLNQWISRRRSLENNETDGDTRKDTKGGNVARIETCETGTLTMARGHGRTTISVQVTRDECDRRKPKRQRLR